MLAKESPIRSRCASQIYDPHVSSWHDIRLEILHINKLHFGCHAFSEDELRADFTDPKCVAVVSKDMLTGGIMGYTYTTPLLKYPHNMDLTLPRHDNGIQTAYLWQIALHQHYIGQGLVRDIMKTLEPALITKGYKYLELSARIENGFAAKIERNNSRRILYKEAFVDEHSEESLTLFRIGLLEESIVC